MSYKYHVNCFSWKKFLLMIPLYILFILNMFPMSFCRKKTKINKMSFLLWSENPNITEISFAVVWHLFDDLIKAENILQKFGRVFKCIIKVLHYWKCRIFFPSLEYILAIPYEIVSIKVTLPFRNYIYYNTHVKNIF